MRLKVPECNGPFEGITMNQHIKVTIKMYKND